MREPGVIEQLVPGEFVRLQLTGEVDGPLWQRIAVMLLVLISGHSGDGDALLRRTVHVGTTEHNLVIAEIGWFHRVLRVWRAPLNKVKVVFYAPESLEEKVQFVLGEAKPLSLYFYHGKDPSAQTLIDALGGVQEQPKPEGASGKGKAAKPETSSAR